MKNPTGEDFIRVLKLPDTDTRVLQDLLVTVVNELNQRGLEVAIEPGDGKLHYFRNELRAIQYESEVRVIESESELSVPPTDPLQSPGPTPPAARR